MTKEYSDLKVLIVDDYERTRISLAKILQEMHCTVLEAENGFEALNILKEQKTDLLITDIVMPEVDGFELCEEVRKSAELCRLPIIVNSSHCDANYIVKALRMGADDYVIKPVSKDVLNKIMQRLLFSFSLDSEAT